jgi:hypothetical protein
MAWQINETDAFVPRISSAMEAQQGFYGGLPLEPMFNWDETPQVQFDGAILTIQGRLRPVKR